MKKKHTFWGRALIGLTLIVGQKANVVAILAKEAVLYHFSSKGQSAGCMPRSQKHGSFSWLVFQNLHSFVLDMQTPLALNQLLLGSKDLGFYVFRTLMCIVGKPWSKQSV